MKELKRIKGRVPEKLLLVDDNNENIRENEGRAFRIRPFGESLGSDNELHDILAELKNFAGANN